MSFLDLNYNEGISNCRSTVARYVIRTEMKNNVWLRACHSRTGGNPKSKRTDYYEIPACAGMTEFVTAL